MLLLLLACQSGAKNPPAGETATPAGPQDLLRTSLELDLDLLDGQATIDAIADEAGQLVLDIGDLNPVEILLDGAPASYHYDAGVLTVDAGTGEHQLRVTYGFLAQDEGGWVPDRGVSELWPASCGALFPCDPSPAEGQQFTLALSGIDAEATRVYPTSIEADAPAYMLGFAVGAYTEDALGTTSSGTAVSVWSLPGEQTDALVGTRHLVDTFDLLETTYGAYTFGDHVGPVGVASTENGAVELHPYWHVASPSMESESVHAHEAAHGWYGNGVRIACWEDLVLSEGTAGYIGARALGSAGGENLFANYVDTLDALCATDSGTNGVAMPTTCGAVALDALPDLSTLTQAKGACFFEDTAQLIGVAALDEALADFYQANVGQARHMQDLLDAISAGLEPDQATAFDTLVYEWLTSLACPADYATRCGSSSE